MSANWLQHDCKLPSAEHCQLARARQQQLTKPQGSLGKLEQIAETFAAWQANDLPHISDIKVRVFAADHGICAQGVSAFPAEVTRQMISNFLAGGAAISVLSRQLGTDFSVVNLGTAKPMNDVPGLNNLQLAPGTTDFSEQPAMSETLLDAALTAGANEIDNGDCQLFIGGEMGIGNTTSAAALLSAISGQPVSQTTGRGTGISDPVLAHKQAVIEQALSLHKDKLDSPRSILAHLGGLEIAALTGAYIRCAQRGIPVLLDGFIATVAAVVADRINPGTRPWLVAAHQSTETGHAIALRELELEPLLQLNMGLGEGSGAAVALPVIQSALLLHRHMATFEDASVSQSATPEGTT